MYNGPVYRNIFYNESSYVNTCITKHLCIMDVYRNNFYYEW